MFFGKLSPKCDLRNNKSNLLVKVSRNLFAYREVSSYTHPKLCLTKKFTQTHPKI